MARLPSIINDINAFFKDESFAGLCNTVTLPKVVVKTTDMVLAGYAGDIERDLGKLEKLESEVTISAFDPKVIDLVGDRASRDEQFVIRGAVDADGQIKSVIIRMQGFWKSYEHGGDFKGEEEATLKFAIAVDVYGLEIDGKEVVFIDKPNNIFRVNGKDRNQAIREALAQ
ncbi:phage major tail tube protein [Enterovibrio norvegicus]|uniref:phage major tail tube protein n=1 Tax=Enterovibrio norvegicus TaxID=188144 RepID=UPI000C847271|nr:phage major tail tube protein [Enterovibrio norvegicus]PMN73146.1 hypothetical protein BCT27_12435 [Enterovibrio norvegicus]